MYLVYESLFHRPRVCCNVDLSQLTNAILVSGFPFGNINSGPSIFGLIARYDSIAVMGHNWFPVLPMNNVIP